MGAVDRERIERAWEGRISGCQLGKPVELLSMRKGFGELTSYLEGAGALPLRDYVPAVEGSVVWKLGRACCKGFLERAEPDDDINYTVLALELMEQHGLALTTADVGRAWLQRLPAAAVFTAERAAYRVLLNEMSDFYPFGGEPGFDLALCADNEFNEWIGAQIRADLYGWVCPGRPTLAADLARRDAALSHRGDGVHGAAFVAALGAAIPDAPSLSEAVDVAATEVPAGTASAEAIALGRALVGKPDAPATLHAHYPDLSPVHTVNNLALVVWGLLSGEDDYSQAVGDTVAAGWDTDCNGATVGGLWGLSGREIPSHWTDPWQRRVGVSLAGYGEIPLSELVDRTIAVAETIAG